MGTYGTEGRYGATGLGWKELEKEAGPFRPEGRLLCEKTVKYAA
jgi:hypothetical protein